MLHIPDEDMILKLADALHCNYKAISDYSLGAAEDIIETLFWLEESATYFLPVEKVQDFRSIQLPAT